MGVSNNIIKPTVSLYNKWFSKLYINKPPPQQSAVTNRIFLISNISIFFKNSKYSFILVTPFLIDKTPILWILFQNNRRYYMY